VISTVLLAGAIFGAAVLTYPSSFVLEGIPEVLMKPWRPYVCALLGLVSGMIIGGFTEYMTSHGFRPVRELAESCKTGAATNIIYGLALGYKSTIVPALLIALTSFGSCKLMGYYGVALAALGMLSNLPISLALDGYGPISDNAGGIAEMAIMGHHVRERTDALDAAGNTTAAIGKGFAIGSAALVALSLYGGFLHNSGISASHIPVSLTDPSLFAMLLVGAMVPYLFSAMTMKSVGEAALEMVEEIRRQIREKPGIREGTVEPDYKACIRISTRSSLIEMIAPGLLVRNSLNAGYFKSHYYWNILRTQGIGWIPTRSSCFWCADGSISFQYGWCLGQC
jgi:H(+)-translocating pyrophosphatase